MDIQRISIGLGVPARGEEGKLGELSRKPSAPRGVAPWGPSTTWQWKGKIPGIFVLHLSRGGASPAGLCGTDLGISESSRRPPAEGHRFIKNRQRQNYRKAQAGGVHGVCS